MNAKVVEGKTMLGLRWRSPWSSGRTLPVNMIHFLSAGRYLWVSDSLSLSTGSPTFHSEAFLTVSVCPLLLPPGNSNLLMAPHGPHSTSKPTSFANSAQFSLCTASSCQCFSILTPKNPAAGANVSLLAVSPPKILHGTGESGI